MGTFRETNKGLFYRSEGKPSKQDTLFSPVRLVNKLYLIGTSVANIARRTGLSQDKVRKFIRSKGK